MKTPSRNSNGAINRGISLSNKRGLPSSGSSVVHWSNPNMSDTIMFPPPPPEGLNYIAAIRPSLNFILVLTPLGSVLVPLILTLYFFSTPNSRRHPVFILNILACCSGICEAAINAALEVKQIIYPLEPVSPSLLTAVIAFSTVSPLFIDSILLFRILAFYPPYRTPRRTLIAIFALPLLVKCGRFTAVVMYLHSFTHSSGRLPSILLAAESTWPKNPYIITEWTLQMTDNTWVSIPICLFFPVIKGFTFSYASAFFLYKIYQLRKTDKDVPIIRNGEWSRCSRRSVYLSTRSYQEAFFLTCDHYSWSP